MAGNKTLKKAQKEQNDEFYTQLPDIEHELKNYKEHFKGKTIFLNCDDPEESHFWKFFELNFDEFQLKKLVSTHYETDIPSYKLEIIGDINNDGKINGKDIIKTPLSQNGDFRSPEAIELLKEADIIVTNPPFSLLREYVALLMEYEKKFVIMARTSALHYKEIFPLIKENKIWVGYNYNISVIYKTPYPNLLEANRKYVSQHGYNPDEGYVKVPAICWFTNLDITRRHEDIILYKKYSAEEYPKYDNFDAIEVGAVSDIPMDYDGMMGVPDTFIQYHNPEQFEIIGLGVGDLAKTIGIQKNYRGRSDLAYTKQDGKPTCPYSRLIIRRVQNEN